MPIITKDAIRAAQDLREELVPVPEWGDGAEVLVRGLSKAAMSALREGCSITTAGDDGKPRVEFDQKKFEGQLILAGCAEPRFTPEDLAWLVEKAAGPLDRVSEAIARVSGLGKDAVKDAKSAPAG